MRWQVVAPLLAAMFTVTVPSAMAGDAIKFGELLKRGYEVKSASVIPEEVAQRAGGADWKDGVMLLLQKADSVAFCHFTLSGTIDPDGMHGNDCFLAN
jgi:hypothetical protein